MSALASQMGGMHLQNGAGGGEGNGPAAGTGMPYSQVSYYQNQQPYYVSVIEYLSLYLLLHVGLVEQEIRRNRKTDSFQQDNSSSYAAAVGNQQHYGGGW